MPAHDATDYGTKSLMRSYDRIGLTFFEALSAAARDCAESDHVATYSGAAVYHVPTDTFVVSVASSRDGVPMLCDVNGRAVVVTRSL